jgi:hypothetical protein
MDTDQDMDLLYKERSEVIDLEISEDVYKKIIGWENMKPGDKIRIEWKGDVLDGIEDEGYIFQLPFCDDAYDMLDFFVHIPSPDNSSGIGDAPQVFTHFISLMLNKLVQKITIQ